ncbi:hypothetical protein BDN72DRAFT_862291 [Pluteus cervinus]|uniref:Uncharacterized protein n=1 Tax=Pluteus cervinus TaxID=181527 RepID=A0ACD3AD11_9AGAR|nr:hypothetical protein BDN72DRAFT_862291 [Pluteus cervinus]
MSTAILTTILELPDELLAYIFELVVSHPRRRGKPSRSAALTNIRVVCKRWNAVALGHTTLWSTITRASQLSSTEYLARSKDGPVTIELKKIQQSDEWEKVLQNLKKIDSTRIKGLHLHYKSGDADFILEPFKKYTPLQMGLAFPARVLSVNDILSVLQTQPALQSLCIFGDMESSSTDSEVIQKVPLPNLSSLEIQAGIHAMAKILPLLDLPLSKVHIHPHVLATDEQSPEPNLLSNLLESMKSCQDTSWRSATVTIFNLQGYRVQVLNSDGSCALSLEFSYTGDHNQEWQINILNEIDWSTISKLTVRQRFPRYDLPWNSFAASSWFRNANELTISIHLVPSFLRALHEASSNDQLSGFFPNMNRVTCVIPKHQLKTHIHPPLTHDVLSSCQEIKKNFDLILTPDNDELGRDEEIDYQVPTQIIMHPSNPSDQDVKIVKDLFRWRPMKAYGEVQKGEWNDAWDVYRDEEDHDDGPLDPRPDDAVAEDPVFWQ